MRNIIFFLLCIFVFTFTFTSEVLAQVVINEFSPVSDPEWVELYNTSENTESLEDYVIFFDDKVTTTQKYEFCGGEQISGNSYKLITRPTGAFWLANNGDGLVLKKAGNVVDSIIYGSGQVVGIPKADQSATRNPDGSTNWVIVDTPSPQGDNIMLNCPTPTSAPTEAPTTTPTLTHVPTSAPTTEPTVIVVATKKPTIAPRPVTKDDEGDDGDYILGLRDELMASPSPESGEEDEKKFPFMAGLFLFGGTGLIGVAGFTFFKNKKKEYNKDSKKERSDGFNKIEIKRNDNKKSS
jgi:hypothetical protein